MPIYNFQAQFADAVRSGAKRQTIRARGKRPPPSVGQVAHCYVGLRTNGVSPLGKFPIESVTRISISTKSRTVSMSKWECWIELDLPEIEQLARDDGFDSADAFFAFFCTEHGSTFSGYVIKWRYQ